MKNLNLCKILKGHEGEIFYSPIAGDVKLLEIVHSCVLRIDCGTDNEISDPFILPLYSNGAFRKDGETMLFPSKDQRDWNKWIEEQKPKIPKTWSELLNSPNCEIVGTVSLDINGNDYLQNDSLIEKSALALLKIYQLIEVGYGGNITDKEWNRYCYPKYFIEYNNENKMFKVMEFSYFKSHIAFHTKEQAEEFLKYSENIQLLKDYFMI